MGYTFCPSGVRSGDAMEGTLCHGRSTMFSVVSPARYRCWLLLRLGKPSRCGRLNRCGGSCISWSPPPTKAATPSGKTASPSAAPSAAPSGSTATPARLPARGAANAVSISIAPASTTTTGADRAALPDRAAGQVADAVLVSIIPSKRETASAAPVCLPLALLLSLWNRLGLRLRLRRSDGREEDRRYRPECVLNCYLRSSSLPVQKHGNSGTEPLLSDPPDLLHGDSALFI
jgi:hypothetical protein